MIYQFWKKLPPVWNIKISFKHKIISVIYKGMIVFTWVVCIISSQYKGHHIIMLLWFRHPVEFCHPCTLIAVRTIIRDRRVPVVEWCMHICRRWKYYHWLSGLIKVFCEWKTKKKESGEHFALDQILYMYVLL